MSSPCSRESHSFALHRLAMASNGFLALCISCTSYSSHGGQSDNPHPGKFPRSPNFP